MFYLVSIYTSVKLTFITQKYVIFLLAVLRHHTPLFERLQLFGTTSTILTQLQVLALLSVFGTTSNKWQGSKGFQGCFFAR